MSHLPPALEAERQRFWDQHPLSHFPVGLLLLAPVPLEEELLITTLAKQLLCQNQTHLETCKCKSCVLFQAGHHPDYLSLQTASEETIGIEQIAQWLSPLFIKIHQKTRRVLTLFNGDNLTEAAMNRLLKTIEEPPPATHFIIRARSTSSLLPTLRSRLHVFTLSPWSEIKLVEWLRQNVPTLSTPHYVTAARLASGSPALAKAACQPEAIVTQTTLIQQAASAIQNRNMSSLLTILDQPTAQLANYAILWLDWMKLSLNLPSISYQVYLPLLAPLADARFPWVKLWQTTLGCQHRLTQTPSFNKTLALAYLLQQQTQILRGIR